MKCPRGMIFLGFIDSPIGWFTLEQDVSPMLLFHGCIQVSFHVSIDMVFLLKCHLCFILFSCKIMCYIIYIYIYIYIHTPCFPQCTHLTMCHMSFHVSIDMVFLLKCHLCFIPFLLQDNVLYIYIYIYIYTVFPPMYPFWGGGVSRRSRFGNF
jgi:hypothetical protein